MSPYSVFECPGPIGRPTNLGSRRWSGIWPPSKPGRVGRPERDFWPRLPKPHDCPWPAEMPRPLRLWRWFDPGDALRLPRSMVSSAGGASPRVFQSNTFIEGAVQRGPATTGPGNCSDDAPTRRNAAMSLLNIELRAPRDLVSAPVWVYEIES